MGKINILNDAGTSKLTLEFNGSSDATVPVDALTSITGDVQSQIDTLNTNVGTKAPLVDPVFTGNVGIGISSNLTAKINLPASDYGEAINYYSYATESNRSGVGKYINELRHYIPSGDNFTWVGGGPSGTERMRIDSNSNLKFNSGYGYAATAYGCRAWVQFDGKSITTTNSGNVSSITDGGTGRYMINFATALPDTGYAVSMIAQNKDANDDRNWLPAHECKSTARNRSTTQFPLDVGDWFIGGYSGALQDANNINFTLFR